MAQAKLSKAEDFSRPKPEESAGDTESQYRIFIRSACHAYFFNFRPLYCYFFGLFKLLSLEWLWQLFDYSF